MTDARLRLIAGALALAGLAIATYLTVVHYDHDALVCVSGSGGCEKVQNSDYAELVDVPVALIGALGYGAILVSLALPGGFGRFLGALFGGIGFGFTVYLTYLELFVIDAVCQWCVASAVVMALLTVVLFLRFLQAPAEPV